MIMIGLSSKIVKIWVFQIISNSKIVICNSNLKYDPNCQIMIYMCNSHIKNMWIMIYFFQWLLQLFMLLH